MDVAVQRTQSPRPGAVRFQGVVKSRSADRLIWFDVPEQLAADPSETGETWALALLPLALQTGEPLRLSLPIDPTFLENLRGLIMVWRKWYPDLRPVEIAAATRPRGAGAKVLSMFSGGVDSWFTLLRRCEPAADFPQVGSIDDLLTVGGFDIPVDRPDEFAELLALTNAVAAEFGKRLWTVSTNLREHKDTFWWSRWGPLSHVAGLAAATYLLGNGYREVLIPSTHRFIEPFPFGSHPLTDPLFSTALTFFRHDHALYPRTDKIQRVALSDAALSRLKVCWLERRFANCSNCGKCHRTLLCLDLLGALPRATTFDLEAYGRNRRRPMLIADENTLVRVSEILDLAVRQGRNDLAAVMRASIERSRVVTPLVSALKKVSWRLGDGAHRLLSRGMIGT